jgi:hypothetical protein
MWLSGHGSYCGMEDNFNGVQLETVELHFV